MNFFVTTNGAYNLNQIKAVKCLPQYSPRLLSFDFKLCTDFIAESTFLHLDIPVHAKPSDDAIDKTVLALLVEVINFLKKDDVKTIQQLANYLVSIQKTVCQPLLSI